MKRIDLVQVPNNHKIGEACKDLEPNIIDDCIFYENNKPIGFFIKELPEKAKKLAILCNTELRSKNVPKSAMNRSNGVEQYSTIIGAIPPKANFRRNYLSTSRIHNIPSAKTFIKAMYLLALESEKLIKDILPEQYKIQLERFKSVSKEWKIGNIFTSSISNYNINANYHIDKANIVDCCNVIITKRHNSLGGNLHLPDYNAVIGQCDNSILVYPAWKSMHGVTPIIPIKEGGYRNSLVFYPLKAFLNTQKEN